MKQTQAFFDALQIWKEQATQTNVQDFDTLLFILEFRLGEPNVTDEKIEWLRNRVEYLVDVIGIDEDFVINGLVDIVTNQLTRNFATLGEAIVNNEMMLDDISKDHPEYADTPKTVLEKLKEPTYSYRARKELDIWLKLVADFHGDFKRNEYKEEKMLAKIQATKSQFEKIPSDIKEVIADIPFGKLKKVGIQNLKNLTIDQAKALKEDLMQD